MDPAKAPGRAGRLMALAGTHPPTADRVRNVMAMTDSLEVAGQGLPGAAFQVCKAALAGLPAPPPGKEVALGAALAAVSLGQATEDAGAPSPLGTREEAQVVMDLPGGTVWQAAKLSVAAGQVVEIWKQLRGEAGERQAPGNPNIGLVHNVGGSGQTCAVTIFERI